MYCVHRGTAEKQYYYTECSLPLQKISVITDLNK